MLVVPDASVILKWVLPREEEPGWDRARAILDRFVIGELNLAVPSLWYFEAGNTLVRRFGTSPGAGFLRWLQELALPEVPPAEGWGRTALDLVADHGVTFYDASYLAVAMARGGTLVTADAAFVRKVGQRPGLALLDRFALEE